MHSTRRLRSGLFKPNTTNLHKVIFASLSMLALGLISPPLRAQQFAHVAPLAFTKPFAGANPLPQTITAASTGTAFGFEATWSTASGGNWLSLSGLGCGNSCGTTPFAITVGVSASPTLAAGTYTGQIVLTSQGRTTSLTIPVTLTVAPVRAAFFDDVPGQMSFSFKTAAEMPPPAQDLQIRNGGSGSLAWTLKTTTADGASWLSASTASGTAPSLVKITLNPGKLPGNGLLAGTFIGQLAFRSASGSVTVPVSVVVGDSVFRQVNAIDFTKPFAGANPLPQTLTIASTDTPVGFYVSSSNSRGGDWLSVSGLGCGDVCGTTPFAVTVAINAAPNLPVGTYTAQVVITSSPNTMAMTVPVTLTVAPPQEAFFDNVQGQMSFSMKTAAATPPAQELQIRNAGSEILDWTLETSTADGGNWLTASVLSGTAPARLSITIHPANLPNEALIAGTFVGQLLFRTATSSVTVPVSVALGGSVFRQVNGISFTKPFGGANPLPQTLTIASTDAPVNFYTTWSTATGGNWLSVSGLGCGNSCGTAPFAITVAITADANLAVGTYTGQVVITSSPNTMAMTIPVTLTVAAPHATFFDNLPGQMSFFMKTAAANPPGQSLQIRNGGLGTLAWSLKINTADGGNWLSASALSGGAPAMLGITIRSASLPGGGRIAGTFTGELVFEAGSDSVTVPVSVVVGGSVFRQANPMSFTKRFGGPNPLLQTLTIASTNAPVRFYATWSTAQGGNWLSVSGLGCGNSCGASPFAIAVAISASTNLAAGTYTGQIVITSSPNTMAMTIPVTLTVANPASAYFDNLQGQMSFSFKPGGNPAAQTIQVRNAGPGALAWTLATIAGDGGNWLTASVHAGTAPSTITVRVVPGELPGGGLTAGTFTGQLVFRAPGSSVSVPVSVTVGPSVFVQLNQLSFTKRVGGPNPLPHTLTIASTGTAIGFYASWSSGRGGAWLSVSGLGCGGVCGVTPKVITVTVNANPALGAGTYTGEIVITSSPNTMAMTIPVVLQVSGSGAASVSAAGDSTESAAIDTADSQ